MKVTNISSSTLFLRGLKFVREAQNNGGRGEDRYLAAGASIYLPNTTEVMRSAKEGELYAWAHANPPLVSLEDQVTLDAGDNIVLEHGLGVAPVVYALKQVLTNWVDATGAYDVVHNSDFTETTFTNTTEYTLTFYIRLV